MGGGTHERTDERTEERTDERMNERKSPCVLQDFVPFGAAAQKEEIEKEEFEMVSRPRRTQ